mmetsp:Transcript_14547/g.31563  ORF Transcript_14547/g.31563 Transcript_14547/m.31563 type:complete len:204 (+) Transcript_14547:3325-3936(+)
MRQLLPFHRAVGEFWCLYCRQEIAMIPYLLLHLVHYEPLASDLGCHLLSLLVRRGVVECSGQMAAWHAIVHGRRQLLHGNELEHRARYHNVGGGEHEPTSPRTSCANVLCDVFEEAGWSIGEVDGDDADGHRAAKANVVSPQQLSEAYVLRQRFVFDNDDFCRRFHKRIRDTPNNKLQHVQQSRPRRVFVVAGCKDDGEQEML